MPKKKTPKKAPDKQVKNRNNLRLVSKPTQFKKGVSGNPKGRPKKEDCLTSLLQEELAKIDPEDKHKRTHAELVVLATIRLARKGNAAALREVWERSDGKVKDRLEVKETMSDQAVLLSEVFTLEELKDMQKRINKYRAKR